MKKILLIEDDSKYSKYFKKLFNDIDVDITAVEEASLLFDHYEPKQFDLIITDLFLPDIKGCYVVNHVKQINPKQKMAILTNLPTTQEELNGFKMGVDEFLAKDMDKDIIIHRILNLIKDVEKNDERFINCDFEKLRLDLIERRVYKNNKLVNITEKEFLILRYLLENKNEIISREKLLQSIWKYAPNLDKVEVRTIDAHIKNLRKKLGLSCILSVRGEGYRWYEQKHN